MVVFFAWSSLTKFGFRWFFNVVWTYKAILETRILTIRTLAGLHPVMLQETRDGVGAPNLAGDILPRIA